MKHVLITGATSGIGKDLAYVCLQHGYMPILTGRNQEKLIDTQRILQNELGKNPPIFHLDLLHTKQIKESIDNILSYYEVDVLINNAGYGKFSPLSECSVEHLQGMFQVNMIGLSLVTQTVLPKMVERKCGHIINIASLAGKMATANASIYAASKHAVLGFTNALRLELHKENILVTSVNLGPVATSFFQTADASGQYEQRMQKYMLNSKVVATRIVSLNGKKKRELNLPYWMGIGARCYQLCPVLVERILGRYMYLK